MQDKQLIEENQLIEDKKLIQDKNNLDKSTGRRQFIKQAICVGSAIGSATLPTISSGKDRKASEFKDAGNHFNSLPNDFIYLNSGTEGSMSDAVYNKLIEAQNKWASDPTNSYETDPLLGKYQVNNRQFFADLYGVQADNISLTDNTTMGMSMVLMGLNFKASDTVILTNQEHNAIVSPLSVQQAKTGMNLITRSFPKSDQLRHMNAQQVIDQLFPKTKALMGAKALCVSHVYPTTGVRLPLSLLRKRADELKIKYLIVDGAQSMGMIDLTSEIDHITLTDFYACPGHKWLNGPPSTGMLFIKNSNIHPPEFYPTISQRMTRYLEESSDTKTPFPMAEALQVRGCSNTVGYVGMREAIEFQRRLGGFAVVESTLIERSTRVKNFIKSKSKYALVSPHQDDQIQSALTVFYPFSLKQPDKLFSDKVTCQNIVDNLREFHNIQIRYIGLDDAGTTRYALRVSTALFNDTEQLKQFFTALEKQLDWL